MITMASKLRPPKYVLASVAVSLGGLLNGFDTGSIGAITSMPQFAQSLGKFSASLLGFTVSIILLTGTVPSVFAGHLADKYGRLKIIIPGAILFGAGALIQGTSYSQAQLIVGRSIGGFGEGTFLSIMSTYICEIAPVRHRGTLAGLPQFMSVTGISLGYFTCYGSIHIDSSFAWRLPFIAQVVLSALFILCCFVLPESPRWLQIQGKGEEAKQALERLEVNAIEAERIMVTTTGQAISLSPWRSFLLLFRKAYRQRTILALFILGMVQLSGIDAILYYAPILFKQAGLSSENASFLASGVSGILMLAISVPGFLLADKWGRRTSAITGGVILSGCMFLIGALYASGVVHSFGIARWVVIVSVFAFGLTYCATWGIVGKIYASEIQPDHTRAAATCVAQGLGFFTNWLVAILAPILLEASSSAAYFLFGGLALSTVAVLVAYMPETRGRTLEDIQEAFHRPSLGAAMTSFRQSLRMRKRQAPAEGTELESRNATGVETSSSLSLGDAPRPLRLGVSS
ncbi:general substrate transporter [Xylaria scruposa]|nr:general substrate transporter [Xylaria scruposa]